MDELSGTTETAQTDAAAGTTPPAADAGSFAENIQAESPQFTKADLDAKLAEREKAWQAEQEKTYGWAKGLTAEHWQTAQARLQREQNDPIGYANELMRQAAANPQFAPIIQQRIAQVLAGSPVAAQVGQTQTASQAPGPDLRVQNPDGSYTQMYSAERMAEYGQWLATSLKAEFGQTLKPLQESHQQAQAREEADAAERAHVARASAVMDDIRKQPGFTEHEAEIAKAYQAALTSRPPRPDGTPYDDLADVNLLWQTYTSVMLAKTSAENQSQALAQHARQAAASTTRPHGGTPSTPTRDSRPAEQQLESHLRALSKQRAG